MKTKFLLITLSLITFLGYSQEEKKDKKEGNGKDLFDKVYNRYSGKKKSIVVLKDGTRIEGFKKDVDRKKGQIYYIKLKEEKSGKKIKLDSDEIKEMYLYPSGFEKFTKSWRHVYDVRQWERSDMDNDVINQGYIYFKNQKVSLKNRKKEKEYMMQLINPTFSKYIEVFGDPNAKETTKLGAFGFNVAGGLAKSYYVKKDGKIFWLRKKDLDDKYEELFGDCKEFMEKNPVKKIKWRYFSQYVLDYTKMKAKE
ncbi:hypothetical protein [uncultured Tenacibaculum sp.]|uniref:hypothetical protein n=1 Tax=uncultured Tenacibaculum sp. TaxID=174713 RepID=UPI002603D5FE|nr:hypothetical protein [uncultured Tenacibaculum sp.]